MSNKYDYLVVGGGLLGMLSARELAASGDRVAILDKNQFGQESSWAGGGILSPLYPWRYNAAVNYLASWGQSHYPDFAQKLKDETGVDSECLNSGLLILELSEQEKEAAISWASKTQSCMSILNKEAFIEIEPELFKTQTQSGIWMPEVHQIRNPYFVKALKTYLINHKNIDLFEGYEVQSLLSGNNRVDGCVTSKGKIYADNIIIAGGAWSSKILSVFETRIDIEPVKGQMLLFKGPQGKLKRIILSKDRYVIPRKDGHILVGSTLEKTSFDKSTTESAKLELMLEAKRILPAIEDMALVKHWAGLRPGSPDGIPYIGKYPLMDNLYINSGHYRNGVVLGLASARLLADIVLKRQEIINPDLYSIKR